MRGTGGEERDEPRVWVFVGSAHLPARWRDRAEPAFFVPLAPEEAVELLREGSTPPLFDPADQDLARLATRGATVRAIARELDVHPRTVERRLAALRKRFGVESTAELRRLLSRGGF